MNDQEKRIAAYHEIDHALVAAKQINSAPVQKITIVPRTSGLELTVIHPISIPVS